MSLGRADISGGLRPALRAVIILTAIVLVILVFAPTARAASSAAGGWQGEYAAPRPAPDEHRSARAAGPDKQCSATYHDGRRPATLPGSFLPASSLAAAASPEIRMAGARNAGYGPCGQPSPFDPYGLGSLLWRGPDWGDPAMGHRT